MHADSLFPVPTIPHNKIYESHYRVVLSDIIFVVLAEESVRRFLLGMQYYQRQNFKKIWK